MTSNTHDDMFSPGAATSGLDAVTPSPSSTAEPRGRSPIVCLALAGAVAFAAGLAWVQGTPHGEAPAPAEPLPVIAPVPDFALSASDGRGVTREDLLGSPWVVDFIFTHCSGPCPTLTLRMRSLQESLRDAGSGAKLLSISLDPTEDTPAVLREYAVRAHADPSRWWFLTGTDEKQVHEMVRNGFLQTVQRAAPGLGIVHSAYFLVLDARGRIRGAFDGLDPDSKPKILAALSSLDRERAAP